MMSPSKTLGSAVLLLIALVSFGCARHDPLPSWNDTAAKRSIIKFVDDAVKPSSAGYIPEPERIATFDNDGTLWTEQPLIQGMFAMDRLQAMARVDPSLRERQPFKAALEGDKEYLHEHGEKAIMELVAQTHAGMTQEEFEAMVVAFFATAEHPTLGASIVDLAYKPMVEVMEFLRDNGFDVYICSGGGADFVRAVSERMYGVPPENVIGSTLVYNQRDVNGRSVLWRTPELRSFNDKAVKPANIQERIGRRPAFAAGNVRSGGDIEMLRYSQGRYGPSLQVMVNHDDGLREFAYAEQDGASLKAAREYGWTVVNMKADWNTIFAVPTRLNAGTKEQR